jgi:manganese/iron transport system substrate-binding protein
MSFRYLGLGLLVLGLAGCGTTPQNSVNTEKAGNAEISKSADNKPVVVASYSVLCDLTRQVAQETINLKCLMPAGQDPHTYQPTTDDRKAIDTSALVLYGGYEFEPQVIKLVKASGNQNTKVAVHEIAVPNPLMSDHEQALGEAKSDTSAEKEVDPHVWHNAKNGIAIVQVIQDKLTKLAPQNSALYAKNATALRDRLAKIDTWIRTSIATIPAASKKLVTTHDALSYYGVAYGLPIEGALQGISTEEKPTASRVKALVDEIKRSNVPTIFAELTVNPKLIETVAKEANVKLASKSLFTDGLGEAGSGADHYGQMLIANTTTIVEGLGGTLTPAP